MFSLKFFNRIAVIVIPDPRAARSLQLYYTLTVIVDVLSDKSCGSKNFMSQNLTYYTSLKRSD